MQPSLSHAPQVLTGMFTDFAGGFPKSEAYLQALYAHLHCQLSYDTVSLRIGRQVDEDFALLVHAHTFIGSAGGFDALVNTTRGDSAGSFLTLAHHARRAKQAQAVNTEYSQAGLRSF